MSASMHSLSSNEIYIFTIKDNDCGYSDIKLMTNLMLYRVKDSLLTPLVADFATINVSIF